MNPLDKFEGVLSQIDGFTQYSPTAIPALKREILAAAQAYAQELVEAELEALRARIVQHLKPDEFSDGERVVQDIDARLAHYQPPQDGDTHA